MVYLVQLGYYIYLFLVYETPAHLNNNQNKQNGALDGCSGWTQNFTQMSELQCWQWYIIQFVCVYPMSNIIILYYKFQNFFHVTDESKH